MVQNRLALVIRRSGVFETGCGDAIVIGLQSPYKKNAIKNRITL
jgi:hypothetical protein